MMGGVSGHMLLNCGEGFSHSVLNMLDSGNMVDSWHLGISNGMVNHRSSNSQWSSNRHWSSLHSNSISSSDIRISSKSSISSIGTNSIPK